MDTNYKPFFSIIIPTRNSGETIAACINSVLHQSFDNYELLMIDGGSTDNTLEIAASFNSSRLNVISGTDDGVYDAMNKGIKQAKGTWLYFLGSDDTLYCDIILMKISREIKNNPASKIVFGDVFTSDDTIEKYTNYGFIELLDRCICHQAIFYHHTLFENKLYSLDYKICADWDFNMQVFTYKNHPVHTRQLIAKYNLNGLSANWQQSPEYLNSFANKKALIIRYKGKLNLYFYYTWYYAKRFVRKINARFTWMFQ
jgi:glycosyltransferase involved in cell wall biosynthesis